MTEHFIDAAITDSAAKTAMFFIGDQYVVYDYDRDRVRDGVHSVTEYPVGSTSGFPPAFAPEGPATSISAALEGRGPFNGFEYFFANGSYLRFDRGRRAFDPPAARDMGPWHLPPAFATPDAAYNGALNRSKYGYFFKGSQYVRYIWATDQVDAGYPKPISNMVGMPAPFTSGVDAAVDGAGPFADASYLFKDDNYLRFQWVAAGEPHADGVAAIKDKWPGLAELLAAAKAKSTALVWLARANALLAGRAARTLSPSELVLVTEALGTHFHLLPGDGRVPRIVAMFARVLATLRRSASSFRFRTDAEAVADLKPAIDAAYAAPWPPSSATGINFTRNFVKRSILNRVSSVIHEAVHVNDVASAASDTHIPEWYLTAPSAALFGIRFVPNIPDFATRYDLMTADKAIHNPASYATFARHVTIGDGRELP